MSVENIDQLQIEIEGSSANAAQKINELVSALNRLKSAMGGKGFGNLKTQIDSVGNSATSASKKMGILKNSFRFFRLATVTKFLGDAVTSINDYVENVNLFQVSMGEYYDEAFSYAQLVNEKLGVDPSQWMRTQGVFMSMGKGFGMTKEQAFELSESLTELSYDIGSLYNEDVESAALRLQSALAGEIEPIRRLGISISQATLEEYAFSKGIKESVANMTEQEKALLRSMKLIEDSKRIGAVGDFAKTLESPANAMRVLNQQIEQFRRSIGSVMLPILIQVIPYVQAFVSVLTDLISRFAILVGFNMPEWDNNSWGGQFEGAAGAVDDTTAAVKKLKNATIGLDELNIISPQSAAGAAGAGGVDWAKDIQVESLWNKQQVEEMESKTNQIKETMEAMLPLAALVGGSFLAWKLAPAFVEGFKAIDSLLGSMFGRTTVLTPLMDKLKTAMKFGGVLAVIGIIVGRFFDLYQNSEKFRTGLERVGEIFHGVFTVAKDILGGVWEVIKNVGLSILNLLPDHIKEDILRSFQAFQEYTKEWDLDVKDLLITLAGIGLLFIPGGQILGIALLAFETLSIGIRAIGSVSDETWENIKKGFQDKWNATKEFFEREIMPLFSLENWARIGKQVVDGLFKGLGALAEGAGEMVKELLELVCDILGIHSPSKEFESIGEYSVAGMEQGFSNIKNITLSFENELGVMRGSASAFAAETMTMIRSVLDLFLSAMATSSETAQLTTNDIASMFRSMSNSSVSAINAIITRLNAIPRNITTVHTVITKSVSGGSKASAFAEGGFPEHGQMFIARESGPELVGSIGRKTAVANNSQIIEGIRSGVYEANAEQNALLAEQNALLRSILAKEGNVYLDGKSLKRSVDRAGRESGATISSGGVLAW